MHRTAGDPSLTSGEWDQLQALLDRFEQAGPHSGAVDLDGFLPLPGDRLYLPALNELVKRDLELRWRNGRNQTRSRQTPITAVQSIASRKASHMGNARVILKNSAR